MGSERMDDTVSRNLATPPTPPSPEVGVALVMVNISHPRSLFVCLSCLLLSEALGRRREGEREKAIHRI